MITGFRSSQIYSNVFNTSEENIDPDDNDSCEIYLQKSLPECMPNKMGEYADPFVFCAGTNIEPVKKFRDLEIQVDTKQVSSCKNIDIFFAHTFLLPTSIPKDLLCHPLL